MAVGCRFAGSNTHLHTALAGAKGAHIPCPHSVVHGIGHQVLPIGAQTHACDRVSVPRQRHQLGALAQVPDLNVSTVVC